MAENDQNMPLVGLPADCVTTGEYHWHRAQTSYVAAVAEAAGCLPVIVPAFGEGWYDWSLWADRLDGIVLTGAASNVHPHHYGGGESRTPDDHDRARDATTLPLIHVALERGLPLLAICRGFQELNVALGGTLHQQLHEVEGRLDHRDDPKRPMAMRYAHTAHDVTLEGDGLLASLIREEKIAVNSLHHQGIDRLAERLVVEARAPDGTVEAARVRDARRFAIGVQWHPEWQFHENPASAAVFRAFGDAVRAHADARREEAQRIMRSGMDTKASERA